MKRVGLLLLLLGILVVGGCAEEPFTIYQHDGSSFEAIEQHDNYMEWNETLRGYKIIQNESGWWTYALDYSGKPVPSPFIVTADDPDAVLPSVRTDKGTYIRDEVIKINFTNNFDFPIYYAQRINCGLSFYGILIMGGSVSFGSLCDWIMPQHDFTRLDSGESLYAELDSNIFNVGKYKITVPYFLEEREKGDSFDDPFLTSFSKEFTIIKNRK